MRVLAYIFAPLLLMVQVEKGLFPRKAGAAHESSTSTAMSAPLVQNTTVAAPTTRLIGGRFLVEGSLAPPLHGVDHLLRLGRELIELGCRTTKSYSLRFVSVMPQWIRIETIGVR